MCTLQLRSAGDRVIVMSGPMTVVNDEDGEILAFANLMPVYKKVGPPSASCTTIRRMPRQAPWTICF